MIISKKLSELKSGDLFEWKKWSFKKTGDYTAVRQGQGTWDTWMFKRTDIVQVTVPDPPKATDCEDDDDSTFGWFKWGIIP